MNMYRENTHATEEMPDEDDEHATCYIGAGVEILKRYGLAIFVQDDYALHLLEDRL